MPRFVLGSSSAGRLHTLRRAGIEPLVRHPQVDEATLTATIAAGRPAPVPAEVAGSLARAKAESVATGDEEDAIVLGCDSMLEVQGVAHGKPTGPEEAVRRWRAMRGRSGVLHTGHWLIDRRAGGTGGALGAVGSTTVHFADVSDEEIGAYVATGEPLRVAGAFTIDGYGAAFVTGVEGDHHNVVGLSLPLLRRLLAELDVAWHTLWNSG